MATRQERQEALERMTWEEISKLREKWGGSWYCEGDKAATIEKLVRDGYLWTGAIKNGFCCQRGFVGKPLATRQYQAFSRQRGRARWLAVAASSFLLSSHDCTNSRFACGVSPSTFRPTSGESSFNMAR